MKPLRHQSLAAAVLVTTIFLAYDAYGQQEWHPTASEIAQLPKFCWNRLQVPNATGDEFRIRDCGVGWNHYCSGLLHLIRAKGKKDNKGARMSELGLALNDIRYTEGYIKDYPQCSIREHVAASKAEVLNLQKVYGDKPFKAK